MTEHSILLLIDPDSTARKAFREAVDELGGIQLFIAEDGQEGLDILKGRHCDMVSIRRNAAVLDAFSFSVLMRQDERYKDVPLLVMYPEDAEPERDRLCDAGCSGCIKQPFTKQDIKALLKEWLKL
ncbi:MAG: hypothetical protein PHC35_05210 [Deltaproteobacteria bacterium]|jgi:CheY-like chemotaxis protein|nr:hypothetical protein [Deltaproteobacteria bacterium]